MKIEAGPKITESSGRVGHDQERASIDRDARISEAIGQFLVAKEGGHADRSMLLAKYKDVADELAGCLDALDFINDVAPQLGQHSNRAEGRVSPSITPLATLGDFRILRELGRGGMGMVYEAEQLSIGRRVALKVLPFAAMLDKQQLNRFKNEARAAGTLDHPNIVAIFSVGVERGVHYYAMHLVEGESLAQVIARLRKERGARGEGRGAGSKEHGAKSADLEPTVAHESKIQNPQSEIPTAVAALSTLHGPHSSLLVPSSREYFRIVAKLGIQAAEALDHAHANGILHRDVKPANLMVDDAGKLWVTDFGLARLEADAGMTMTGDLIGTLRYMSPEQALAKRVVVDHRSDVYSLGATLYELLTLEPAFPASDRHELLRQIAFEEPRKLRQVDPQIPRELETIVLKAMEKNAAGRYATAKALADDLRAFLDNQPIKAKPPTAWQRTAKWSRRHRPLVVSSIGVAAAMVLISLIILASSNVTIMRERNEKAAAVIAKDKALQDRSTALAAATWNYDKALEAIDRVLARVANEKLAEVPQLDQLRMDVLEDTLEFYEAFLAKNPDDHKIQFELARSHSRLGSMRQDFGRMASARWHRERAIEIFDGLIVQEPKDPACRHELAVVLYQDQWISKTAGAFERSVELFEGLVKEFPDDLSYREGLADALRSYGDSSFNRSPDMDISRSILKRTFEVARPQSVYRRFLGHAYDLSAKVAQRENRFEDAEGDYREAIRAYAEAVAERPTDGRTREHHMRSSMYLAQLYEGQGANELAEQMYRTAFNIGENLNYDFPRMRNLRNAQLNVADAFTAFLIKTRRPSVATKFLAQLKPVAPQDLYRRARLFTMLGKNDLATSDYRRAVEDSRRSLQDNPSDAFLYACLFESLSALGQRPDALAVVRTMPADDVDGIEQKSILFYYFDESELTPADNQVVLGLRSRLIDDFPRDGHQLVLRAEGYARMAEYDMALADLSRALALDSTNASAWHVRATVYVEMEQDAKAISAYSEAIRINPRSDVYTNRGISYYELRQYDKAIDDFKSALHFNEFGWNWHPEMHLAWLLATADEEQFRDGERALELAQAAYDARDIGRVSRAELLRALAAAHAEVGNFESAVKYCEEALERGHENEELRADLVQHLANYRAGRPWRHGDEKKSNSSR